MIEVSRPAPFWQARALFAQSTNVKPILGQCVTYQLTEGDTFGLSCQGELLAVMGFWRDRDGDTIVEELFLGAAAAERVRPHVPALVRAGRLIVRERAHTVGVDRLVMRTSSRADASGYRLARAMGSVACPIVPPGALLLWEYRR